MVSIKGDPEVQSPERQAAIIRQMDAIGCVQSYLRKIERDVQQAIKDLEDAEADRVEVLTGGLNNA